MTRKKAPDAQQPEFPVATGADGLYTSEDLFGDVVDAPPWPTSNRSEKTGPVKVRVADAVQAEAASTPPGGGGELPPEVAALLDAFGDSDRHPSRGRRADAVAAEEPNRADVDRLLDAFSGPAEAALRAESPSVEARQLGASRPRARSTSGPGPIDGPASPSPSAPIGEHLGLDPDWDSLIGASPSEPPQGAPALPIPEAAAAPSSASAFDDVVDTLLGDLGNPRPHADFEEDLDSALADLAPESRDESASVPQRGRGSWRDDRYGPYQLLDRVAVGGMAEVFKARYEGVEGFEKIVAVKRILPHLSDNPEFVEMFVEEAKMVAGLSHANIVQIHDLGRIDKSYFIAMEFVRGRDLRSILRRVREKGMKLPLDMSLLIVREVCAALDYAHRKRDERGRPMRIVHRDVSPQNILISFEGDVKLADFGIAKAATKASSTEGGALRGKLMYMSPEQAWGHPMDGRSDIFSLGLVLYEMVTDVRPFVATSEMSILEMVRACQIRPAREVNPRLPDALDLAIATALARDVEDRYQDAGEMGRALERVFLDRHLPTAADLVRFLAVLFDLDEREEAIPDELFPESVGRRELRLEEHAARPAPRKTHGDDDFLAELGLD